MSTLREHYNEEELAAATVLDMVAAGGHIADETILWALWILGDLVGAR